MNPLRDSFIKDMKVYYPNGLTLPDNKEQFKALVISYTLGFFKGLGFNYNPWTIIFNDENFEPDDYWKWW